MKPWREVVVPRPDVLSGTAQQAEFAADLVAVRNGIAVAEYQDAAAFFDRTYITEGMRLLLTQVIERLSGRGGEPVIQLQTSFGGGKTHTMIAVYHLVTRTVPLSALAGIQPLLTQAGVMDVPKAAVAVLDGNGLAPNEAKLYGKQRVNTLWGNLAWQLGGAEGYALVSASDGSGTSPGKTVLQELLTRFAPCVILIDELVAYVRQFVPSERYLGGTYDSNMSFLQALTEAVKQVPEAVLLVSLPQSDVEAGSTRAVEIRKRLEQLLDQEQIRQQSANALKALEKTVGRVHAIWKPVDIEESFEIVRSRLFQPVHDPLARDAVCRAFADLYAQEGSRLPAATHESRYQERMLRAYPIHPELFDRLYEDWSPLESFQRTRGVLKLMAYVIHELWAKNNQDRMILPASLPLSTGKTRNELIGHLNPGWDPVLERDVDSDHAGAAELDRAETRFGAVQAARRVARTAFFGSAPANGARSGNRGMDRAHILLGCLEPGQPSSLYSDALNRLADRLHHLNLSADKALDTTRFWFDVRANLRQEMEERKRRTDEQAIWSRIKEEAVKLIPRSLFDAVHHFAPHGDVPDDVALRLVVLPPEVPWNKEHPQAAIDAVGSFVRNNGSRPRLRGNRLVFIAPDSGTLSRLRDVVRTALAWRSIVEDIDKHRLVIDQLQAGQARTEGQTAEAVVKRAMRDCYRWLLCPIQHRATDREIQVESFQVNAAAVSLSEELQRVCAEQEIVITAWSPIHLKARLDELYWKPDRPAIPALSVWEDMQKFLFLPRLKDQSVFTQAVRAGLTSRDFFATAFAQQGERFEGFQFGTGNAQVDKTLLLIEPAAAAAWERQEEDRRQRSRQPIDERQKIFLQNPPPPVDSTELLSAPPKHTTSGKPPVAPSAENRLTSFFGVAELNPATATVDFIAIERDIIRRLTQDPHAVISISIEIRSDHPNGVPDVIRQKIEADADDAGMKRREWE